MPRAQSNPFGGNAALSGPSDYFFPLVAAQHSDALPLAASGVSKLPVALRAIRCLADATITIQSSAGGYFSLAMKAGDVHDTGYAAEVNFSADGSFVGYA